MYGTRGRRFLLPGCRPFRLIRPSRLTRPPTTSVLRNHPRLSGLLTSRLLFEVTVRQVGALSPRARVSVVLRVVRPVFDHGFDPAKGQEPTLVSVEYAQCVYVARLLRVLCPAVNPPLRVYLIVVVRISSALTSSRSRSACLRTMASACR